MSEHLCLLPADGGFLVLGFWLVVATNWAGSLLGPGAASDAGSRSPDHNFNQWHFTSSQEKRKQTVLPK